MKNLKLFFLAFLLMVVTIDAQWTTGGTSVVPTVTNKSRLELYFAGTADSLGGTYATMYSALFSLDDYAGVNVGTFSYILGAPAGSPKLNVFLVGSDYTTTGSSMITLKHIADSATTTTETFGTIDFSAIHAKYYRLKIASVTTGRANPTFKVWLILPKRNF